MFKKLNCSLHDILDWIDGHPRTGWYLVFLTTINFIIEVLTLFF